MRENEHKENELLKIYDIKKGNEIIVNGFEKSKCYEDEVGRLRDCVEIDTVTKEVIILKIDSYEELIIKKYKR